VRGFAYHGNKDFELVTNKTRGPAFFESMFYIVTLTNQTFTYWICPDVLNPTNGIMTPIFPTTNIETTLSVPLLPPSAAGATVYIQAVVFNADDLSISNHLALSVSK
jgi:hypothetical protein